MVDERDSLIESQKQVIGILFEIVKRQQANNDLDHEYFQIVTSGRVTEYTKRLTEISDERNSNAKIIGRLLKQIEI